MWSIGATDQKAQSVAFIVLIKHLDADLSIFHHFRHTDSSGHSLRHLDLKIWRFLCGRQQQTTTELIPCTCAWGKNNWMKLMGELGMAVLKNIQTRVVEILRYTLHPYCFSSNQWKAIECRMYLTNYPYYPCLYTAIPTLPISFIQLFFILATVSFFFFFFLLPLGKHMNLHWATLLWDQSYHVHVLLCFFQQYLQRCISQVRSSTAYMSMYVYCHALICAIVCKTESHTTQMGQVKYIHVQCMKAWWSYH